MSVSVEDADTFLVNLVDRENNGYRARIPADDLFPTPDGIIKGVYQESIARYLKSKNLVTIDQVNSSYPVLVSATSDGVMRAKKLMQDPPRPSIVDRLASETSQRLVNFGNFVIAGLALVVAIVALIKAK